MFTCSKCRRAVSPLTWKARASPTLRISPTPRWMRRCTSSTTFARGVVWSFPYNRRSVTDRSTSKVPSVTCALILPQRLIVMLGGVAVRGQPKDAFPWPSSTAHPLRCALRSFPKMSASLSQEAAVRSFQNEAGLSSLTQTSRPGSKVWSSVAGAVPLGCVGPSSTRRPTSKAPPLRASRSTVNRARPSSLWQNCLRAALPECVTESGRWCADSARWASSGRHVDHRYRRRVMISI